MGGIVYGGIKMKETLSKMISQARSKKNLKALGDVSVFAFDCGEITEEDLKELNCQISARYSVLDKDEDQLEIDI